MPKLITIRRRNEAVQKKGPNVNVGRLPHLRRVAEKGDILRPAVRWHNRFPTLLLVCYICIFLFLISTTDALVATLLFTLSVCFIFAKKYKTQRSCFTSSCTRHSCATWNLYLVNNERRSYESSSYPSYLTWSVNTQESLR